MNQQPGQLLPDDVLSDILRRLGPHGVAASRRVCKAWRDVVDTHRMLPADAHLLPLSMTGIFVVFCYPPASAYFSRPGSLKITTKFDYIATDDFSCLEIEDHCNGLLLLHRLPFKPHEGKVHVLNPGTRQWAQLPTLPDMTTVSTMEVEDVHQKLDMYLAFDPTLSPHYEVFLFNSAPHSDDVLEPTIKDLEWPPSQYVLPVFSSRTSQWEKKPFIRQGEAAGTIGDMSEAISPCHHAAYWRGALYVPQHDFIIRITLSSDKYQVIKLPLFPDLGADPDHYIGKCKNGVYCALLYGAAELHLRIWFLDEPCGGQPKWELKDDINFQTVLANSTSSKHWMLQYVNEEHDRGEENRYTISLLGFHPFREIFFFQTSFGRAVAYHFNSSKIEDIGCLPTKEDDLIYTGFTYTLCQVGDLSDKKLV